MHNSLEAPRFAPQDLLAYACGVRAALGVPDDDAREVAACLLEADLSGVYSHGLVRLPVYGWRIRAKVVNPQPAIGITSARRPRHCWTETTVWDPPPVVAP